MFIGHVATALAAKRIDPRPSLGTYVLAATWPDVLFSLLLLGGWEQVKIAPGHTAMMAMAFPHYPYSHSLVSALLAGAVMAALYWIFRRNARAAVVLAGLVLGHWLLDVITHVPDMPVGLAGPKVGLGLWKSIPATFAVEGLLFLAGVTLYRRATRARDAMGRWALAAFVVVLVMAYVAGPLGPPPPSATAVTVVNNVSLWLLIIWAIWIDRHRRAIA
jgi:membrane-bound metal-dependent hydrolase YbcI (DUF457 family)